MTLFDIIDIFLLMVKGLCFLFSSELDAADRQHEMRGGPRREGCHS